MDSVVGYAGLGLSVVILLSVVVILLVVGQRGEELMEIERIVDAAIKKQDDRIQKRLERQKETAPDEFAVPVWPAVGSRRK